MGTKRTRERKVANAAANKLAAAADANAADTPDAKPQFKSTEHAGDMDVYSVSPRLKTVDDVIKYAKIDLAIWYVDTQECNSYECPMKLYRTVPDKKRPFRISDKPSRMHLWQIKIKLKRRVTKAAEVAYGDIMDRMRKYAPKFPKFAKLRAITEPHMLEISVFDTHFGKLAWAPETGQNYDLKIAEQLYLNAIRKLVSYARQFPVEQFLFPIGQDFFHIDGPENTTTAGTRQDADGRYSKIYKTGFWAVVKAINYLLPIAPVKLLWVPGNHDTISSFHLAFALAAHYRQTPRVIVDDSSLSRKYAAYGPAVIGFTHGNREKPNALVSIMLHEARELMAKATTLEIHTGHRHKVAMTQHLNTDTYAGGIKVRTLPSLSATDKWHYDEGYVGAGQAAEAYLWSKRTGYVGHFSADGNE